MTQLTLAIEDKRIIPHLKKILNSIEGVSVIRTARENKHSITPQIIKGLEEIAAIEKGEVQPRTIEQLLSEL